MVFAEQIVSLALSQDGDRYIFGAEVSASDTNPDAFDCSELVQWACGHLGVEPRMPDGTWYQARHCRNNGTLVSVAEAINTRGALLWRFYPADGWMEGGRPSSAHVAISLGDGTTMEARSSRHGVGVFSAYGRGWTLGALIPGVDYTQAPPTVPTVPDSPQTGRDITMQVSFPELRLYDGFVTKGKTHLQGDVKVAQGLLLKEGLVDLRTEDSRSLCDGKLGSSTEGNVKTFQKSRALTVDGIVGEHTWAALLNQ